MKTKFTSINSVLYDISTMVPEEHWDKTAFLEWAYVAMGKLGSYTKWEEALCLLIVDQHQAQMPTNWKFLTQIVYKEEFDDNDLEYFKELLGIPEDTSHIANPEGLAGRVVQASEANRRTQWLPLRRTSNPFMETVHTNVSIFPPKAFQSSCPHCNHEYNIGPSGCITTTLPKGYLLVSYLRNPTDMTGSLLIPDNEDLKEAILHFVLHRYWMKRAIRKEQGASQERDYHRMMFATLKTKAAGALNSPDIDALENIKNHRDHLVPRVHRYDDMFSTLSKKEQEPNYYTNPRYRITY